MYWQKTGNIQTAFASKLFLDSSRYPRCLWGLFITCLLHLGLWSLPVSMPKAEKAHPQIIRLRLAAQLTTAQPSPLRKTVHPHSKNPKHRRRLHRRRLHRRKLHRRKLHRRKVAQRDKHHTHRTKRNVLTKYPKMRQVSPIPRTRTLAMNKPMHPVSSVQTMAHSKMKPKSKPKMIAVDFGPYKRGLFQTITRHKNYPFMARRMEQQGSVLLKVSVSKQGKLIGTPKILQSSHFLLLDQEALRMVKAAFPWRPMPTAYLGSKKSFRIIIRFTLNS